MTATPNIPDSRPARAPDVVRQPCSEACAAYHPINPGSWTDYGLCLNPRSPLCGYPVRTGRDCDAYRVRSHAPDFSHAS